MPFRLFIARGNSEGQVFIAVQPTVLIGRDEVCDVLLTDGGVSGQHVRLVERDGRVFATDLGSLNGTLLNGHPLTQEAELKDADALGIGTAVLKLNLLDASERTRLVPAGVAMSPRTPTGESKPAITDTGQTQPLPELAEKTTARVPALPAEAQAVTSLSAAAVPTGSAPAIELSSKPPATLSLDEPSFTEPEPAARPAVRERPVGNGGAAPRRDEPADAITQSGESSDPTLLDPRGEPVLVPAREVLRQPPGPPLERPDTVLVPLEQLKRQREAAHARRPRSSTLDDEGVAERESAADRARRKREAKGPLALAWVSLSLPARAAVAVTSGVVLGVLAIAGWQLSHSGSPERALAAEPTRLSSTPVPESFGRGPGVDFERPDSKSFSFSVNTAVPTAVVVHYHARDIQPGEVAIAVDGNEVGFVPADVPSVDRDLEALVSPSLVSHTGQSTVVFDNVKNPPAREPWRVWGLWVEQVPVPQVTAEQALATARDVLARAQALEQQPVPPEDALFRLWRAYRQGVVAMLAVPDHLHHATYLELEGRLEETRAQLDQRCAALLLELKVPPRARDARERLGRAFPTREHPCEVEAEEELRSQGL